MMAQMQDAYFDPLLMTVLAKRFAAIVREMTISVRKSSRSTAVTNGRDMSCGLLTYDHRLVCTEEGMPIHVMGLEFTTRPITELFDDVRAGDAYINNCSYTGGTHHADFALCAPVFHNDEPIFWVMVRSHHADTGMPAATTMDPFAATVFEEGVQLPCVRIRQEYEDKKDIVRMCRMRNRVGHVWYGDYRAQVGGCAIGERRIKELVAKYGVDTIMAFIEAWQEYGKRRVVAAIRQIPKGSWTHETRHDPIPGIADEGVPVRVTVTTDPDEGTITVDARDNVDCIAAGYNLSENTANTACRIGVFYNLDPTIPHNDGSIGQIKVLLRDNCVVGRPQFPVGTSMATTNLNDRLINAVLGCFGQIGPPFGMAEGATELSSGLAVISGKDDRRGGRTYVDLPILALGTGPAQPGHDGWITWSAPNGGAIMALDSIEIDESLFPIVVESRCLAPDTLGSGEWDGAPGMYLVYRPLSSSLTFNYAGDGAVFPPKGVLGGRDAAPSKTWLRRADGAMEELPPSHEGTIRLGEGLVMITCGGGGYGPPTSRDPVRVADTVNRRWLSPERAEATYGVRLARSERTNLYHVDAEATLKSRAAGG
jgi:N-methylhydantoinase B